MLMLTLLLLAAPDPAVESRPAPPNILFIYTDDHSAAAVSCYGSGLNQTPHIDRIAAEGMRFENAFCTNGICAPCRAVVLTGTHSHVNGLMDNGDVFDGGQITFPKLLQGAGYQTALIGKWHVGFHQTSFTPTQRGFDEFFGILTGGGDHYRHESTGAFTMRGPEYKTKTYAFRGQNLWHNDQPVLSWR